MSPRPRDFTLGQSQGRLDATGSPGGRRRSDPHCAAPACRRAQCRIRRPAERRGAARRGLAYVRSLGPARRAVAPLPVPPRVPANAASVERTQGPLGRSCAGLVTAPTDARRTVTTTKAAVQVAGARLPPSPGVPRRERSPRSIWLRLTTAWAVERRCRLTPIRSRRASVGRRLLRAVVGARSSWDLEGTQTSPRTREVRIGA